MPYDAGALGRVRAGAVGSLPTSLAAVVAVLVAAALTAAGWTAGAPAAHATEVLSDSFSRTTANGWGVATPGGAWTTSGSASAYRVDGARGAVVVPPGATRRATSAATAGDVQVRTLVAVSALPGGTGLTVALGSRSSGTSAYQSRLRVHSSGTLALNHLRVRDNRATIISSATLAGAKAAAGQWWHVVAQTEGSGPVVLRMKAWAAGTPEPAAWQLAATDALAGAPASGNVFTELYLSGGAGRTVSASFDDFAAQTLGEPAPPADGPPTARFTVTVQGLTVRVDGTTSSDPDGPIAGYRWSFGDGSTADGPTAQATYAAAGSYPVALVVTDAAGATATATRSVLVADEPAVSLPGPESTGVPEGAALRLLTDPAPRPYPLDTISGNTFTIRTAGAVYDGWQFDRLVLVRAPGVQFRNCLFQGVEGNPPDSALLAVANDRGAAVPSATVSDSTLRPAFPNATIDGFRGSNASLRRVEITGTVDGLHIFGTSDYLDPHAGNVLLEQSWVHDLINYPNGTVEGTHNDGLQLVGGSRVAIVGSRIDGTMSNAAVQLVQSRNRIADFAIRDSYLAGGGCTVNVSDVRGPAAIEGLVFEGNTFVRGSSRHLDCAMLVTLRSLPGAAAAANRWHDGSEPAPRPTDSYLP
jgi:PKD repeat protein